MTTNDGRRCAPRLWKTARRSAMLGSGAEGSHSGLVRPPAKRVGGDELPRGFESRSLRHDSPTA